MNSSHPTYPTARKPHQCLLCYLDIEKGEKYHRSASFVDGTAYSWVAHLECQRYAETEIQPWNDHGYLECEDVSTHLELELVRTDDKHIDEETVERILVEFPGLQRQIDQLRKELKA